MKEKVTKTEVGQRREDKIFQPFIPLLSMVAEAGLRKLEEIRLRKTLGDVKEFEEYLEKKDPRK